jgi:hypothetical protein
VLIFDAEYAAIVQDIGGKYPDIRHFIVVGQGALDGAENYEALHAKSSDHTPARFARWTLATPRFRSSACAIGRRGGITQIRRGHSITWSSSSWTLH